MHDNKHIIAYLDILGFKSIIKKSTNHDYIKNLKDIFNMAKMTLDNYNSNFSEVLKNNIEINIFGDSIIISLKYNNDDYVLLSLFISLLSLIQLYFIESNYFLRGGITIGELIKESLIKNEPSVLLGRGYIEAVELEENAIYPRIICSKSIIEEYSKLYFKENTINFYEETLQNQPIIFDEEENKYYINFYHNKFINKFKSTYDKIKKNIKNNYIANFEDSHICEKYSWLINYHNSFFTNKEDKINKVELICKN